MPKKCAVSRDDAVQVLKEYIVQFKTPKLPPWSANIWTDLAKECDGAWTRLSWWVNVTENRRKILSLAQEELGIEVIEFAKGEADRENSRCQESDITFYPSGSEESLEESWFNLILTPKQWNEIKPATSESNLTEGRTLRAGVWTNIIADEFYRQHRLPCAYSFRRGQISVSPQSSHYLKIEGCCRANQCKNFFHGYLDRQPAPNDQQIIISVRTRNTSRATHEDVRRNLNGQKRAEFGQQSYAEGASNMLKRLRRENMGRGDEEGPNIPKCDVLRHAKMEHINRELGMKKTNQDFIQKIYDLQFERPYIGSINAVGYNPFYVFYGLPIQTSLYQDYSKVMKDVSTICIDGSGSLVQKVIRELGLKSRHIFLHCIVINFNQKLVSVFQMLSESQESETFTYWLKRWVSLVKVKPKLSITDYSRALLTGSAKAFNNMTLKDYLNVYFSFLREGDASLLDKISTYLRVDVAHLIHIVCRWDCTKRIQRRQVRDFFIRCVALMVDCQHLSDFNEIFTLTCAVGSNAYDDTVLNLKSITTVKHARELLETFMSQRQTVVEDSDGVDISEEDEIHFEDDADGPSSIASHIESLSAQATSVIHTGMELNSFYAPKFIRELIRIGKEFVLWTAVGVPFLIGHASSSYAEKNFQDLKYNTLDHFARCINSEKFLRVHMKDVIGGTRGVADKLIKFTAQGKTIPKPVLKAHSGKQTHKVDAKRASDDNPTETNPMSETDHQYSELSGSFVDDSDLMSRENWGGKAEPAMFDLGSESDSPEKTQEESIGRRHCNWPKNKKIIVDDSSDDENNKYRKSTAGEHQIGYLCDYCNNFFTTETFHNHMCK